MLAGIGWWGGNNTRAAHHNTGIIAWPAGSCGNEVNNNEESNVCDAQFRFRFRH